MTEKDSAARMLASAPVALALISGTKCMFLNDAFAEAVGHSREALMAMADLFQLVTPEDFEKVRARHAARLAGENVPRAYELNIFAADGTKRRIEIEPKVLDDGDTLLALRPLGDAAQRRDFLVSLAELQARAQRERTVKGVLDVSLAGLKELAVYSAVLRVEDGCVRMMAHVDPGALSPFVKPMLDIWKGAAGFPLDSMPHIRRAIQEQRSLMIDDLVPAMKLFLGGRGSWPVDQVVSAVGSLTAVQLVIAPLAVHGEPYGAVLAAGRQLRSTDLAALSLFAQQLGAMIEIAQNIETLERKNATLAAIHRVAQLRTELSVDALIPELLEIVAPATHSDEAAIYLTEPGGEWLNLVGTTTPGSFADKYRRIPVQRTATGQAVVLSAPRAVSLDEWPEVSREDVRKEGYHQLAIVPLFVEGGVAGTLNLARRRDERFELQQLREAEMLLAQCALQIERARLLEEARRRVEDLSLVNEVGTLISQHLSLDSVIAVAMSHLSRLVAVQNTFLFLFDETAQKLRMAATNVPKDPLDIVIGLDQPSAATDAVKALKPILIEDAEADPCASKPPANRYGHKSLLGVPLLSEGKPIGSMVLGETKTRRRFTGSEVERAVAIANQLASAIVNARLFESAKDSYKKLEQAQAELVTRERLAALGELSAVVAHEVRNPVAVIFNSVAGIRRAGPIEGPSGKLLDIVHEEAERLNRIVSDLLDFASPYQVKLRNEHLEPLLANALEDAVRVLPSPNVKISLSVTPDLGEVPVDPPLLRQAMVNLLVNALQAMPDGGQIVIRAQTDERNGERVARIDIADDGPGICPEDAKKIFQPFFTRRAKGTGLGLALVKRIAEAHHAQVEVTSSPGKGATFSMWLPMSRSA